MKGVLLVPMYKWGSIVEFLNERLGRIGDIRGSVSWSKDGASSDEIEYRINNGDSWDWVKEKDIKRIVE